jgi:hypothetical protein
VKTEDEVEVERLVGLLQQCDAELPPDSPVREALHKAALALRVAFAHGRRPDIEDMYAGIGRPLSKAERQHLRELGIEPPSDD